VRPALRLAPLALLAACKALTPAQVTTIATVTKDACAVADVLDPTLSTVVCALVDDAENVIAARTIVCPTPAAAAAVVGALPATPTLEAKIKPLASLSSASVYRVR
jgi:uncharacterized protein (DUF1778 family)